jgi:hypothetical protein
MPQGKIIKIGQYKCRLKFKPFAQKDLTSGIMYTKIYLEGFTGGPKGGCNAR